VSIGEILNDYTFRIVALGCGVLGLVSGVLGCFAVLRRQGLLGDALSHAALPGVCLAYMATDSKAPLTLMVGAGLAAWAAMALFQMALRFTKTDSGTALAVILTQFFGIGVVLLTVIQKSGRANQAGLNKFLFGQAAGLVQDDVVTMAVIGAVALGAVALFFKEMKLLSFDPTFATVSGIPTRFVDGLMSALLVVGVVIGLNTVGVVLMSAMLIAPAAAARQWTHRLASMIAISGASGVACGLVGAWISASESKTPTGPIIVLALTAWVVVSVLFGSAKGVLWTRMRRMRLTQARLEATG
jgi:manganese/zinc/iron transport system permease protein